MKDSVNGLTRRNNYIPPIAITVLFCGLSIFLFNEYGVKIVNDSDRYLEYARNLKNGFYFDKHNFWYIGYVFFIFVVQLIHKGPFAIVVAQYLLSFIAVLALYKSSLFVFKDTQSATITAVGYMLFMEILTWNSYILCESLYCSLTCISLYFLTSSQRHSSLYAYVIAVIVVSITILTKPTGIALFGAILAIVLLRLWKHVKGKGTRIAFAFVLTTFFTLIVNRMLFTFRIIENYELGEIIYAITTLPYNELYDSLIINPPKDIHIPSADNPPLWRVIIFIAYNPLYFLQLFCSKLFFFLFHIRPYWSWIHNMFVLCFLLPFYFYCLRALSKRSLPREIVVFSAVYFLIHCVSIGLTSADWDGRFLMPLLPLIFLLGASEIAVDYNKLRVKISKPESLRNE